MDRHNADVNILRAASALLPTLPRPFVAQITTLSMHEPYSTPNPDFPIPYQVSISDPRDRSYLSEAMCFDRALGEFLNSLKSAGIYDSSIIAIVADHAPRRAALGEITTSEYIPFIIINSGINLKTSEIRLQTDLFPTLLDIMGVDNYRLPALDCKYRGVGTSLLQPSERTPYTDDSRQLFDRLFYSHVFE